MNASFKQKWLTLIDNFIGALHINVCIVDAQWAPVIVPNPNPHGWKLISEAVAQHAQFKPAGEHLEFVDGFKMHYFAIPFGSNKTNGYIVLGPVVLNKRLEKAQCEELAAQLNRDFYELMDHLDGIRVLSFVNLKYILDFTKGFTEMIQETLKPQAETVDVFGSMLELSFGAAQGQSGSIMLFDLKTNTLKVCAAQGLHERYLQKPQKLDEGVAGIAFQKQKTLILDDSARHNRIGHLLNRKEIKQSIVMPFETSDKKVRGVLNLNINSRLMTKDEADQVTENLSQIATSVLKTL